MEFVSLGITGHRFLAEDEKVIAGLDRACTYDRAGYGWSDPGPRPRTPQQFARELHTLLHNAGEPPPYLMVGHSLGGMLIRQYASQYPQELYGAVMIDAGMTKLASCRRILPRATGAGLAHPRLSSRG